MLKFRTAVKPPTITGVAATSTSQLDPVWSLPVGFSIVLTELEFSLNGTSGWTPIYSGPALTFAHTGRAANTTYYYRARVQDSQGHYSLYSSVASATTPSGNYIKWYRGHYVQSNQIASASVQGYQESWLSEIENDANIVGLMYLFYWGLFETSRDVYNFGPIDNIRNLCAAYGKKLTLHMSDRIFNASSNNGRLPTYLTSEPGGSGGIWIGPEPRVVAKIWLQAIMDRELAAWAALAARYDGDPVIAAAYSSEITPGNATGDPTYSTSAMTAQWKRWANHAKANWLHTPVFVLTNSLAGGAGPREIIEHVYQLNSNVGVGDTDVLPSPHNQTPGMRVWEGIDASQSGAPFDYRGRIPYISIVQSPTLGGKESDEALGVGNTWTMQQIYAAGAGGPAVSGNRQRGNLMGWVRSTVQPRPPNQTWANDILPALRAHPSDWPTAATPTSLASYELVTS